MYHIDLIIKTLTIFREDDHLMNFNHHNNLM